MAAYVYNSFTNKDKKEANKRIDILNFELREKSDENNNLAEQVKHSYNLIQKYETDIQDLKEQLKQQHKRLKNVKKRISIALSVLKALRKMKFVLSVVFLIALPLMKNCFPLS